MPCSSKKKKTIGRINGMNKLAICEGWGYKKGIGEEGNNWNREGMKLI